MPVPLVIGPEISTPEAPPLSEEAWAGLLSERALPRTLVVHAEPTCKRCYTSLPDDTVREADCPICGCRAQGMPLPWSG